MDANRPKPAHSWGELISEIGVIVLGVLIALGAEQALEALHWRSQMDAARTAMRTELTDSAYAAEMEVAIYRCDADALARLRADLLKSGPVWKGRPIGFSAPLGAWNTAVWQAALASGTLAHMDGDDMAAFAVAYQYPPALRELDAQAQDDQAQLELLEHDLSLGDGERGRMLAAVNRSDRRSYRLSLGSGQFEQAAAAAGVVLSEAAKAKVRARIGQPDGDCLPAPKPG